MLGILSQRLVRRLCLDCLQAATPTDGQRDLFGILLNDIHMREGAGCEQCHFTGYDGRVGLYELAVIDDRVQDLISAGAPRLKMLRYMRSVGFIGLLEHGLSQVNGAVTSLAEIVRVVPYRQIAAALALMSE
jgi:general secretion pathway protein E/type IV pilus assembly protein PilB